MDAFVQLIRNGFCCIKDLELLQDTFLWDPNITLRYYDLPEPLNKTMPLEVFISVVQLYVVYSATLSGWNLLTSSYGKVRRIRRLMDRHHQYRRSSIQDPVDRLIQDSLVKEGVFALRSLLIGSLVFCIGLSFIWLAANSWHITETDWIGGLPGLIHALTVTEICLVPLLYYMYKDGTEQLAKAVRMEDMAAKLKSGSLTAEEMGLSSLEMLTGWLPFWDAGMGIFDSVDTIKEEKLMAAEKERLKKYLEDLLGKPDAAKDEKEDKILKQKLQDTADELLAASRVTRLEGYREYIYLVLNFIAFYGYLLGIIVFYFQEESQQPTVVKRALLGMDNSSADWHGNFAGDLMWTIEPLIILGSPPLLNRFKPERKKIKTD